MILSRRQLLLDLARLSAGLAATPALAGQLQTGLPPFPMCTSKGLRKVSSLRPQTPSNATLHPGSLARFVDALPIPEVLRTTEHRPDPENPRQQLPYFRVTMREAEMRVHRDLPPTRFWGYASQMPGPTFDVRSGQPLLVDWVNDLPTKHLFEIDHNLHGAGRDVADVRTVVHVHGARVPAESDGYPERWFMPGQSALYRYPMRQDATTLWYHDHTMGIERLNQYAGLFGAFLIRDAAEDALRLPGGEYEIPLMISDRLLGEDGQLQYPDSGIAGAPWVSEAYGDAMLVNGKLAPYLDVEPRPYRFRVINASNARFYYLSLGDGVMLQQIGSDQGLLSRPSITDRLTLAPAERADLVIDFSQHANQQLILQSQALQLMQFRVSARAHGAHRALPARLRDVPKTPRASATVTRTLTLNTYEDPQTHMMLMLLNGTYWGQPVTEKPVLNSTEIWELVNLTDDTHPIHLHLVRFQILDRQKFDADEYLQTGKLELIGETIPPEPGEAGWKDTVQAHPGLITRIIIRFEGYPGRYVWHCHVLEHAANEMMRPFDVIEPPKG